MSTRDLAFLGVEQELHLEFALLTALPFALELVPIQSKQRTLRFKAEEHFSNT